MTTARDTTDYSKDFLPIHNDDLIPIKSYEGIVVYQIDYHQAEERNRAFNQKLIDLRIRKENKNTYVK